MSTEQASAPVKSKGGRPAGYKPVKKDEVKAGIEAFEDGTHLIIKIPKKMASKILLKDLF